MVRGGLAEVKGGSAELTHWRRLELKTYSQNNGCKHEKQRHLVAKIMFRIFFVEAQDPFNILATVFGRSYYPVKSHFRHFHP